MKKLTAALFLLSFFSLCFCQTAENESKDSFFGKPFQKPSNVKEFFSAADFVMDFSPAVYVNPESGLVSAPSPVIYPVSIGMLWPNYTFLAFEPTFSTFMMYHLWYGNQALPAEIENRTSSTFTFIFNFPAVISIYPSAHSRIQFSSGAAIFIRYGILANGVKKSDSGYSGSAGEDLNKINQYFWQNGHFLYLSTGVSWLYSFTEKLKAGPVFKMYLPIGSIISGEGLQGMIVSLGLKLNI